MKKFSRIVILFALLMISATGAHGAENAKSTKKIRLGAHFYTMAGLGAAQVLEIGEYGLREALSRAGYTLEIKKYSSHDEVYNALINGEIDGGLMWPSHAARAIAEGHEILPILTYSLGNARKRAYCIWSLNDKKPKTASDIMGDRFVTDWYNDSDLILLRNKLFESGIDKPIWNVFSTFMNAASQNAAHMAIAFDEADYYWDTPDAEITLKILSPAILKKVSYTMCTEPDFTRGSIFILKSAMSDADYKKFKNLLKKDFTDLNKIAAYNPAYKGFDYYIKQSDLELLIPDDDEFNAEAELYKKGMKNGWLDEANYIIKVMQTVPTGESVSINPSEEDCAKICKSRNEKQKCVSACLGN